MKKHSVAAQSEATTWHKLYELLVVLNLYVVFCGFLTLYFGQDVSFDLRNYHYYIPWAFLNDRFLIDNVPAGLNTYYNPLLDYLTYFCIEKLKPQTASLVLSSIQSLNGVLVYYIAKNLLKRELVQPLALFLCCLVLGVLGCSGSAFLTQVGGTKGDSIVSIFILGALLLSLQSQTRFHFAGFLILGIGVGLKLTQAIFILPLIAAMTLTQNLSAKQAVTAGVFVLCGFAVSYGYWFVALSHFFDNPFFPYLNQIFQSPYTDLQIVSPYQFNIQNISKEFSNIFWPVFLISDTKLKITDFRWVLFLGMIPVVFLIHRHKLHEIKTAFPKTALLTIFICMSIIFAISFFPHLRFLIAIEAILPIIIFVSVLEATKSLLNKNATLTIDQSPRSKEVNSTWLTDTNFISVIVALCLGIFLFSSTSLQPHYPRIGWQSSYFKIKITDNKKRELTKNQLTEAFPKGTLVLYSNFSGYSYLIPSFPKTTHFASLGSRINQTNISKPDLSFKEKETVASKRSKKAKLTAQLLTLSKNSSKIYFLRKSVTNNEPNPAYHYQKHLKELNLKISKNCPLKVTTVTEPLGIPICEVSPYY